MAGPGGVNEREFVELTSPHRAALHAHCYRMLGSLHDADDAMQETLLRAWRSIDRYEARAPIAAWLYRIATNVCLRMLERARPADVAVDAHLEPYPDSAPGPDDVAERREAVGLAYVAALQLLPPRQRAVLVLRDALDWPARDVAELLDESVPAVNSLLQRARDRLSRDGESLVRTHAPSSAAAEEGLMRRFVAAWEAVDVEGIVALLAGDALLTMPPEGMRFESARAIGDFFATVPVDGRLDRIRLVPVRGNGQPVLAAYADEEGDGSFEPYGLMVFAVAGDRIAGITGFARRPDLFERFGLPMSLAV